MFLEVSVEAEDFSIILNPWGLNSWDRFVLWRFSVFLETQIIDALCQLVDKVHVDILTHILSLLLLAVIGVGELLSLMEVLFVWIAENMPW